MMSTEGRKGGGIEAKRLPIYGECATDRHLRVLWDDPGFRSWLEHHPDPDVVAGLPAGVSLADLAREIWATKPARSLLRRAVRTFIGQGLQLEAAYHGHTCLVVVPIERSSESSGVYIVRQGEHGPIKIGVASNLRERLLDLQRGSGYPLFFIGHLSGGRRKEEALHQRFAVDRLHAEWFRPSAAILDLARENAPSATLEPARGRGWQKLVKDLERAALAVGGAR